MLTGTSIFSANRSHELMTHLRGCQEYADSNEHVALMGTLTAAGRYHRLKKHGKYFVENPNWNGVFLVPRDQVSAFIKLLIFYQHQRDSDELFTDDGTAKLKVMIARVKIDEIDRSKGDAVAYIAKYISKNIDAHKLEGKKDLDSNLVDLVETVTNVTAWSRAFCFRQFQFQKTPSVTVWRELRRIKEAQEFCLFEKIRLAADCGCFASYFNWMGGHRLKQRNRPIKLFYERSENHYQELVNKTAGLTGVGITVLTREKQWKLVTKDQPVETIEVEGGGTLSLTLEEKFSLVEKGALAVITDKKDERKLVVTNEGKCSLIAKRRKRVRKGDVLASRVLRRGLVTKILGPLGFAESGGSRFPWTSVNNCTRSADSPKISGVTDIDTSNLTPKQIYAGSYLEKTVERLNGRSNLAEQSTRTLEVEAKPVKVNPKFKGNPKYKGLSEFNYQALKKINRFETLRCNRCGNTADFYGKSCFIYCASCKAGIEY